MDKKAKIEKHTRVRFTYEDDMALLKEFLSVNPTVNSQAWEIIQQHLLITTGKDFLIRTLKHHITLLLDIWQKKVKVDLIRSGVEEPQCERDALLQEVNALCLENDYSFKDKKTQKLNQQINNMGKEIREASAISFYNMNEIDHDYASAVEIKDISFVENLEILAQPSTSAPLTTDRINSNSGETPSNKENKILGPRRKRVNRKEPLRKNALTYLTDKHDKEANIRLMELELEKRKVAVMEKQVDLEEKKNQLDEKRLDLEFKERLMRVEIEKTTNEMDLEQKKITNQLLTSQQQLIEHLLKEKSSK